MRRRRYARVKERCIAKSTGTPIELLSLHIVRARFQPHQRHLIMSEFSRHLLIAFEPPSVPLRSKSANSSHEPELLL